MSSSLTHAQWRERAELLRPETSLFIDGRAVEAAEGGVFEDFNPSTGQRIANIACGTAVDIDRAVKSARRAFRLGHWSRMAPRARMQVLFRLSELVQAHSLDFALLDCLDMGKPISDLLAFDIPEAVLTFRFFAESIDKLSGAIGNTARSAVHMITREPIGVIGCIVPWNFPLMMAAWKVAPALAAGNSVVLKPAEQSPLSALLLARLCAEAGLPAGVLNVVNGNGREAGKALALHGDVDKIAFTGSTEVGKLMMTYSGQSNMKRVSAECGGKSPQIVLSDAPDIGTAARVAAGAIYFNQGEVCSAASRIIVERSVHDEFVEHFKRAASSFKVGDPLDPETTMGPLVDGAQKERVVSYIEAGVEQGARLIAGGETKLAGPCSDGHFVEPTIFTGVKPDMKIAREEIFGPVASILSVEDANQAIAIANDSMYGLAAGIWTKDLVKAHTLAREVEAGIVWVNCYGDSDMTLPWGGTKQTGHGRDKCFDSLVENTQTKSIWLSLEN